MITIFLYSISVFSLLVLYYYYKPKQQQHQQKDEILNDLDQNINLNHHHHHPDLLSLSSTSNVSDSIVTAASLNDQQSNYDYEIISDNNNNHQKYNNPYTYTNYKESKGEFISLSKNKKKIDNSEAIIVEFYKKYFDKNSIYKYLGLNNNSDYNNNTKRINPSSFTIIQETFK